MDTQNPYAAPLVDVNVNVMGAAPTLATAGARLAARFIDSLLGMLPLVVFGIAGAVMAGRTQSGEAPSGPAIGLMIIGSLGAFALWLFQVIRLVQTGQTLGRKWMGVRIVSVNNTPISVWTHLLRALVLGVAGIISVLFIFRADRRCLHDLAADTRVIVA